MLLDANILLYAVDSTAPSHRQAKEWLVDALNGTERIAFPWQTIGAFLRLSTHPRIYNSPLSGAQAAAYVDDWLRAPTAWVPAATNRTVAILIGLINTHRLNGNGIPDAQLAALAIEHGISVVSADADFARFPEVRWMNPIEPRRD